MAKTPQSGRETRSNRSRVGKGNIMNTQDHLTRMLMGLVTQGEQMTIQHLAAESYDLSFEKRGLPTVAAWLDWDQTPNSIPIEHLEKIPMCWGPTDTYEILVGSHGKKYESKGEKVFRMFRDDPEAMKMGVIPAFLCAMAEADRDACLALWEKGGKKQHLINIQVEPSERVDVQCIRLSDDAVVAQRKGGILGYIGPGGEWGQWIRRRIQCGKSYDEQLIWQGIGPDGRKGDWLYDPSKGAETYTLISL